jgi:hypothetical protein
MFLSQNPSALSILKENENRIVWRCMQVNPNPDVISMFMLHQSHSVSWFWISKNSGAIKLLINHPDKVNWVTFAMNKNSSCLLRLYPDKINWCYLSEQENAIDLIMKYPSKIDWKTIWKNPSIFKLLSFNDFL